MEGARQFPQMSLRLPPELKEWLHAKAKMEGRSLNSEVVRRLQQSKLQQEAKEMAQ